MSAGVRRDIDPAQGCVRRFAGYQAKVDDVGSVSRQTHPSRKQQVFNAVAGEIATGLDFDPHPPLRRPDIGLAPVRQIDDKEIFQPVGQNSFAARSWRFTSNNQTGRPQQFSGAAFVDSEVS